MPREKRERWLLRASLSRGSCRAKACVLEGGEFIAAPVVISNADPRQTLRLLGAAADPAWRKRVEQIPMEGCTVKLNVLLRELPNFTARPGTDQPHHYGQINTPLTKAEWKAGFAAARARRIARAFMVRVVLPERPRSDRCRRVGSIR